MKVLCVNISIDYKMHSKSRAQLTQTSNDFLHFPFIARKFKKLLLEKTSSSVNGLFKKRDFYSKYPFKNIVPTNTFVHHEINNTTKGNKANLFTSKILTLQYKFCYNVYAKKINMKSTIYYR